jgi:catechol 2,3-dioxygenase-like lactoylglutathione lyase family enzyme
MIKESHVTIMIKDMDRSITFYQSIGFSTRQRWGNHYAQLEAPGVVVGLHPAGELAYTTGNMSLGFTPVDFDEAKKALSAAGIETTLRSEEGGDFIHFTDPDGTPLYFIRPKW